MPLPPSPTHRLRLGILVALLPAFGLSLLGCHPATTPGAATKAYPVRGMVVAVLASQQQIMLNHEAIPGLMEAMAMPYPVEDPAVLTEVHDGDRISATLLADQGPDGPTHLRLKDVVILQQAKPDYKPAVQYHVPAIGDDVPNFAFRNQSDKILHLDQFRGKVLLLTFIYTRCPLADFCPRMSQNFAQIDNSLAADSKLSGRTHLLSISFDPAYDTPAVLRSYGEVYGARAAQQDFAHWDFAAATQEELPKIEQWFDLGVTPGTGNTLTHSLSTVIVGQNGKVVAFYPDNQWSVAEAEATVRQAAAGPGSFPVPPHPSQTIPQVAK